jgi:hypothetical protein
MDGMFMSGQPDHRSIIDGVQDLLLGGTEVKDFLHDLAEYAATSLSSPGNEIYCGITLLRDRSAATVASNGKKARSLDEIQYKFDQGPCLLASSEQVLVHIPDLAKDTTFPDYNRAALKNGIGSLLALPFDLASKTAKAGLNLYSEKPRAFGPDDITRAQDFVSQASKGLQLSVLISGHAQTTEHLRAAMTSRTVIDLAIGVIIAQNRCTQKEAMDILTKASSHRNIKLRDLAAAVVHSAGGGPTQTHFDQASQPRPRDTQAGN